MPKPKSKVKKIVISSILIASIISIQTWASNPINILFEMNKVVYNYTANTSTLAGGTYNITVNNSDMLDSYHASYFCPLNATACLEGGLSEIDPRFSANWTYINSKPNSTFNSTYDSKISYNQTWNETVINLRNYLTSYTENDPRWLANYTAFNNSWSSTFNYTYDNKISYNTSWNETRANALYQTGSELFNTSEQVISSVNTSSYYQIKVNHSNVNNMPNYITNTINNDTKLYFGTENEYCIYYNSTLKALVSTNVC